MLFNSTTTMGVGAVTKDVTSGEVAGAVLGPDESHLGTFRLTISCLS